MILKNIFLMDQFQDSLIRIQKDVEMDINNPKVSTISAMYDVEVLDMLRKILLDSYLKSRYIR